MLLCIKYILFALIAIATNLFSQSAVLHILPNNPITIYLALFVGTGIGLIVKFILDKKFIFYHTADNIKTHYTVFTSYTLTGVLTTVIFWSCELLFHYMFQTPSMTYLGGAIGLSAGYYIKYRFDRKFTFRLA